VEGLELGGHAGCHGGAVGRAEWLLVVAGKEFEDVVADDVVRPGQFERALVSEGEAPCGVDDDDAVGNGFEGLANLPGGECLVGGGELGGWLIVA
jgi:hypothetical protein